MFLVMAHRYGTDSYVFPLGVFDDRASAILAAKQHRKYRGGKYDHRVYRLAMGEMYDADEAKYIWVTGPNSAV